MWASISNLIEVILRYPVWIEYDMNTFLCFYVDPQLDNKYIQELSKSTLVLGGYLMLCYCYHNRVHTKTVFILFFSKKIFSVFWNFLCLIETVEEMKKDAQKL